MLFRVESGPRRADVADLAERELIEAQVAESLKRVRHTVPAAIKRVAHVGARGVYRVEVDHPGRIGEPIDG